jgi:hypothetical protein
VCEVLVSAGESRRVAPVAQQWQTPIGITVGIGAAAMVAAGVVAAMIPAEHSDWRFGTVAVAVVIFAAVSMDRLALALVAGLGALIFNGFLENQLGQLAWHADDLLRLLLLIVAGAAGLAVGGGFRFVRDLRSRYRKTGSVVLSVPSLEEEKHGA